MVKKVIAGVAGVAVLAVAGFAVVVSMQPAAVHVERSSVIAAPAEVVWPYVVDHHKFLEWSPWQGLDPDQEVSFSDSSGAVGSWYAWSGDDNVGSGKMTITSLSQGTSVVNKLEFLEPFEAVANATTTIVPEGSGVKVTWAYDADNDFMGKAMGLFLDMDDMLGPDFQKGMDSLKGVSEQAAAEAAEAERKRVAEEEARRQAAAEGEEAAPGAKVAAPGAKARRPR
jgi:hypothetical protein